jgi:hypothetical protein
LNSCFKRIEPASGGIFNPTLSSTSRKAFIGLKRRGEKIPLLPKEGIKGRLNREQK